MRRTPLRRRRPTRRRRAAPEWSAEQWETATHVINVRQGGRCGWCGVLLRGEAVRHHRKRRRDGGDTYPNVVLLHDGCHRYVHAYPLQAKARGFIVSPYDDPIWVPLDTRGRTGQASWWLTEDGRAEPML